MKLTDKDIVLAHTQHSKEWKGKKCTSIVYVDYGTQL